MLSTTLLKFTLTTYMSSKNFFVASSPSPFLSSPTPYSFMFPMYTHLQQSKSAALGYYKKFINVKKAYEENSFFSKCCAQNKYLDNAGLVGLSS